MSKVVIYIRAENDEEIEETIRINSIEDWMDDVDRDSTATEEVVNWCSRNGYSYDDDIAGWDWV